ncbi:amidohydrolase family protein [Nitrospirillum amazonense]|uniref:Amidohydrolase family protein n=2 Tax=Nitrospirillum amazonense TaxID=28077 RepID=A0A560FA00_9PROT|nr:amidohydrolase family protein [Nitrospirillum amazonense]
MITLMLDAATQDADAELAGLKQGTITPFSTGPTLRAAARTPADFNQTLFASAKQAALALQTPTPRSTEVLRRLRAIVPSRQTTLSARPPARPTPSATSFLAAVAKLQPGDPVPGLSGDERMETKSLQPNVVSPLAKLTPEALADAAAQGVVQHASNQSGIFYMIGLLIGYRTELVRRLMTLPAANDAKDIALITPAMIDFSFWLDHRADDPSDPTPASDPQDVTPLADQINVMSYIARIKTDQTETPRKYAVHPFVSFCPWRQIAEQCRGVPTAQQQFAKVQDAILQHGFMGVKLYPVMGFLPIGNAAAADKAAYPRRLQALGPHWAEKLDQALKDLYDWCIKHDVPVMAHCSFSRYPNDAAGHRGAPAAWVKVFDAGYRNLRLNLSHCGGIWDLAPYRTDVVKRAGSRWPDQVLAMLASTDYPNLYADLADFDGVLECQSPGSATPMPPNSAIPILAQLVAQYPAAHDRLMYGTDYMFLIQASCTENYVAKMRDCLAAQLGMPSAKLMGLNAARFFGLNDPASQTRQRLDRFRGDKFLARWESPSS